MNQPKSSGRGGARKGAGRPPGSATKKTRAIADKAAKEGLTPLEVMLDAMTALHKRANALGDGDEAQMNGRKVDRLGLMVAAADVAKDAAPYIHPRLQAIEHSGSLDWPRNLTDEQLEAEFAAVKARLGSWYPAATIQPGIHEFAGSTEATSANQQASMRLVGASLHVSATESTGGAS